jgi:hypothetical protein
MGIESPIGEGILSGHSTRIFKMVSIQAVALIGTNNFSNHSPAHNYLSRVGYTT